MRSSLQPSERTLATGAKMMSTVSCSHLQVSTHSRLQNGVWRGAPESPGLQLQQLGLFETRNTKYTGLPFGPLFPSSYRSWLGYPGEGEREKEQESALYLRIFCDC